jgi:hypothetical protein
MTVDLKEKKITNGLIERGAHGDQPLIERLLNDSYIPSGIAILTCLK